MQNVRAKRTGVLARMAKREREKRKSCPKKAAVKRQGDYCLFARSAMPRIAANSTEATGQTIQVISHRPEIRLQAR